MSTIRKITPYVCRNHRCCPICNSSQMEIIHHISMILPEKIDLPNDYNVVVCGQCGFSYADVLASQEKYNTYYSHYNVYGKSTALKNEYDRYINEKRFALLKKYVSPNSHIIDLGCGNGSFLLFLKEHGFDNLVGLDPSRECIATLSTQGIECYMGNIFDSVADKLKNAFDVVIFTDVIEHIYDLNLFISRCQMYSKFQGTLFIAAPDVEGFSRYMRKIPNYFNHEHINYFSLFSLDNLLCNYQFRRISNARESRVVLHCKTWVEKELMAVYCKDNEKKLQLKKDLVSEKSINQYFEMVQDILNNKISKFSQILNDYDDVIIWGTGAYTSQLLVQYPELVRKVIFFCR